MTGRIGVFGVRHLSPAGAWHLRRYLDHVRPDVVCVEGLADAGPLVKHLTHRDTVPPVAILAYTAELPVRTLVYPLARYSPEFQAVKWAKENAARVEFIDLPSDIFLGLQDLELERHKRRADAPPDPTDPAAGLDAAEAADVPASPAFRPEPEGSVYARIAARAGEPDYDTYWERRFEHNLSPDSYRLAAHELGRELRDEPDDTAWRAENLVREAFMRRCIAGVVAGGVPAEKIVAVVGAFHAPVLTPDFPAMTDAELASLRRRPSHLTLMPYSYFKLSTQSGYGAGNHAPAYFELFWDAAEAGRLAELPMDYLAKVARHLRSAGTHRSTAEVIEGVRLARTLAALNGGSAPTLRDLTDAAVTLVGHGHLSTVADALARVNVGTAIGSLPPGVSKTSIQDDFARSLDRLKLDKYRTGVAQELALDLRENRHVKSADAAFLDLNRSTFFHRLRVLGVGFAKPARLGSQAATWAEKWVLQWTPEAEIALVEAVLLGETVELATACTFKTRLDACADIAAAADTVTDACQCGLAPAMDLARARLQQLAAESRDVPAVAHAAGRLNQVVRFGDVRKFDPSPLLPLIDELYTQGALGLYDAAGCDAAAAQTLCGSIDELNRVGLDHHARVDTDSWLRQLRRLADSDDRNPLLSGYACGLLLERGELATADLAREVGRRLSPGIPADLGAGWFEGLSRRNRPALLSRQALWAELAAYVSSLDADEFKRAVVFLRRAFGPFTPPQKRQVCENLGELWGAGRDAASEALSAPLSAADEQKLAELNDFDFGDL